jgi:CheY-like chemotaxis protein
MTGETILIVDDVPANIRLLAGVLEPRRYEILTAANADQALRIAAKGHPDVILLDVVMPGTDGIAVCRQLRTPKRRARFPSLVTAKDDTEPAARIRCGVDYI